MAPYHTIMRGHCHDSAPRLLPTGDCGTPVALRHAALRLAKPRRGVTAATGSTAAPAVEAQASQRARTLCGSYLTTLSRSVRTRGQPFRASASKTTRPDGADAQASSCGRHLHALLSAQRL